MNDEDFQKHSENCFFCRLKEDEKRKMKEQYRIVDWKNDYFVMLCERPKISGHLLVVSMHPYNDITQLTEESNEATSILNAVVKWSKILKKCLVAEKVYVMTMCDHWEPEELPKGEKETTEHLHFHLLPRYKANRSQRGEAFLGRDEESGFETRPFVLERIKKHLIECKEKIENISSEN